MTTNEFPEELPPDSYQQPEADGNAILPMPMRAPVLMVIDDARLIQRVVEATLSRFSMEVYCFSNGLEAMNAMAREEAPPPDLILLDLGLPKMGGYEVAQILRKNPGLEHTKIIILTGTDGPLARFRAKLVGAHDFIHKPFRPADLVQKVYLHLGLTGPFTADRG